MPTPPDRIADLTKPPAADELAGWAVQYGPALHRYFAKRIDAGHADDLVQEVFLRLQARAERAPSENVERYLFAVAKSVLIDRFRSDIARRSKLHEPISDSTDARDDISPERILAAKQEYARVLSLILELSPSQRTAFLLHRFGKLSYGAIAKRMGVSKPFVQKLMRRAFRRIMDHMEGGS